MRLPWGTSPGRLASDCLARVFFGTILLATGCSRTANESISLQLGRLAAFYGVQWPTNYSNGRAGSYTYSAIGSTHNTVVVARLQVDAPTDQSWSEQAGNVMTVVEGVPATGDPAMFARFPWWDPQKYPKEHVTVFLYQTNTPSDQFAMLSVDAMKSNAVYILFINSWIVDR